MAKLSRNSLKALVKECLVEILAEGIGSAETITEHRSRKPVSKRKVAKPSRQNKTETDKNFNQAIERTTSSLTDDSVLQDIFADTARTTLQEQNTRDTNPSHSNISLANPNGPSGVDLGGIFDSASQNWSSLAFAENKSSERNN